MMRRRNIFNFLFTVLLVLFTSQAFAEGQLIDGLELAEAPINRLDMDSIKRGAKFFATNCMSCHTLVYMKYDKVAQEAGITYDKMPMNVKTWPFGVTPPDLSLEANVRGVDWIYTYLHSFYKDSKRPTGVNNLLVKDTAMPDIVAPYQGDQELAEHPMEDLLHHIQWYDAVVLTHQGTMPPAEFDATIADVVNFLAYTAEPYYAEQHKIGYWVLGFLVILFFMLYFLKKEYWKDVKKYKK